MTPIHKAIAYDCRRRRSRCRAKSPSRAWIPNGEPPAQPPSQPSCSSLSQAFPTPSPSSSVWSTFEISGQLSSSSAMPSPSRSPEQMSPTPSWSRSTCSGFATSGQLSSSLATPSPSIKMRYLQLREALNLTMTINCLHLTN